MTAASGRLQRTDHAANTATMMGTGWTPSHAPLPPSTSYLPFHICQGMGLILVMGFAVGTEWPQQQEQDVRWATRIDKRAGHKTWDLIENIQNSRRWNLGKWE